MLREWDEVQQQIWSRVEDVDSLLCRRDSRYHVRAQGNSAQSLVDSCHRRVHKLDHHHQRRQGCHRRNQ